MTEERRTDPVKMRKMDHAERLRLIHEAAARYACDGPDGMTLRLYTQADGTFPRLVLSDGDEEIRMTPEQALWLCQDTAGAALYNFVGVLRKALELDNEIREDLNREAEERRAQRDVRSYSFHADQWCPIGSWYMVKGDWG